MQDYLKRNLRPRRLIALLIWWISIVVCLGVFLGRVDLGLWQTLGILVIGLLAYEFAG